MTTPGGREYRPVRDHDQGLDRLGMVHDQVQRLKALPYDSVASGIRDEGDYHLDWTVSGVSPKKVVLVAEYNRRSGGQRADTIVVYVPR